MTKKLNSLEIKATVIRAGLGLFGPDESYMLDQLEKTLFAGIVMGYDLLAARCEAAESIIAKLTMDNNSTPNYVQGFDLAQRHFSEFPDSPVRKPAQSELIDGTAIFPIVNVDVSDGKITKATMFAPGLPDGAHLLYPVLVDANGVPIYVKASAS